MLPIKNFYGRINGVNIYDLTRGLPYELKQQERIDFITNKLQQECWGKYFEQVFEQTYDEKGDGEEEENRIYSNLNTSNIKLILNKSDNVYSETNIAKQLEKLADYILFAPDENGKNNVNKRNTKYNFYTDEVLFQKECRDKKLDEITNNNSEDEVIDFLVRKGQNFKKEKRQVVFKKDIQEIKEIKNYQDIIDRLTIDINRLKASKSDVFLQKRYGVMISTMKDDQILCKNFLRGTIFFKQPLNDSTEIDWDMFSFENKDHVLALLPLSVRTDFKEDLSCLTIVLDELIKKCDFNDIERNIVSMLRKDKTKTDIAKAIDIDVRNINSYINKIANKIIKVYKEGYEDWYYLNVDKGVYKKCSKCKQVKLVSHFGNDTRNNDGFKSYCRECDK